MSKIWRKESSYYTQAENVESRHDGTGLAGSDGKKMKRGSLDLVNALTRAVANDNNTFHATTGALLKNKNKQIVLPAFKRWIR